VRAQLKRDDLPPSPPELTMALALLLHNIGITKNRSLKYARALNVRMEPK